MSIDGTVTWEIRYYFITYWSRHLGPHTVWRPESILVNEHPVKWITDFKKKYSDTYELVLVNWQEVTKEIYEMYKDDVE